MSFDDAMELVVHGFEIGGVAILVVGSLAAVVQAALVLPRDRRRRAYESARRNVGRAILLGLEFLIIADIVLTITVDPTLESALALGLIVLVRTFLSFSLEVELDGTLPWRKAAGDGVPPRRGVRARLRCRAAGGRSSYDALGAASGSAGSSATCSRHHGEMSRLPSSTPARNGVPRLPARLLDLGRVGAHLVGGGGDEDRAHLVLDHPVVHHRAVAEARQQQPQPLDPHAELLLDATSYGLLERARPGAGWPQQLLVHTPGQVGLCRARWVTRNGPRRRRRGSRRTPGAAGCPRGARPLVGGADGAALLVEEDHRLDGGPGWDTGWTDVMRAPRSVGRAG